MHQSNKVRKSPFCLQVCLDTILAYAKEILFSIDNTTRRVLSLSDCCNKDGSMIPVELGGPHAGLQVFLR
jgi:hypothetical protein